MRFTKNLEEETTVIKGQPLYLTCELSKDRSVVWKKNGNPLSAVPCKIAINVIGLQQAFTMKDSNDDDAAVFVPAASG